VRARSGPGQKRAAFLLAALDLDNPEYGPDTDAGRGKYVTSHGVNMPADAKWLNISNGVKKAGYYRPSGTKVVPTVTAYMLVEGYGCTFAFYGSAFKVGKDLAVQAQRLRAMVGTEGEDGKTAEIVEVRGCALGKWRMTSVIEKKGDFRYPLPAVTFLGKLGDKSGAGPTLDQWRSLQRLRQAFKQGLDWAPREAIDWPVPPPKIEIEAPRSGSVNVRSGQDAWDIPPPPYCYDGPDEGEIEY
jgi:hypothetical protein